MDESNEFRWLSGKTGESSFTKPFLTHTSLNEANATHPEFYRRMGASGDDRSYTLLAAMILESQCDALLCKLMPGFNKIRDNRDFSFSMKVELLIAFRLIPSVLPRCVNCVRSIRNEFAHNLAIEKLDDVKSKFLHQAQQLYDEVNLAYKRTHSGQTTRQVFHGIVDAAIYGLHAYTPNISELRRAIDNPTFIDQLQSSAEAHFIPSRPPEL